MKVMIAGFQHETNTFSKVPTAFRDFKRGGMFPALAMGRAVLDLVRVNIAIGGFIASSVDLGFDLDPVIWAGATPSGRVSQDAFEKIAALIWQRAAQTRPDAIYLDLHGAMVCAHLDDGEGALLQRLRGIVGPKVPIVASLDLHANVTSLMFDAADALVAYRTYPHEDMGATGQRAAHLLRLLLVDPAKMRRRLLRLPFLIPINAMATELSPARDAYALLRSLEAMPDVHSMSFAPGFPAADVPGCGGTLWGYATADEAADRAVEALHRFVVDHEPAWAISMLTPEAAVREAQAIARTARRPVIIADTQDNPGAGGTSDSVGMLRALLALGAQDAAIGLIVDAVAARRAHEAGVGATIELALGGRSGAIGDAPFEGWFHVDSLADGRCIFEGPMMRGKQADVGPSACLSIAGVKIAVCSETDQMLDQSLFHMVGIDPARMKILVIKSSVHFRADFEPIAEHILIAKSPGMVSADPADLPWTRLPSEMRVRPLGPTVAEMRAARDRPASMHTDDCP